MNLLVLDLDETLVHLTQQPLGRQGGWLATEFRLHFRPGLKEFLTHVRTRWRLGVWTAGDRPYADFAIGAIEAETDVPLREDLVVFFTNAQCTPKHVPGSLKPAWLKDLRKVEKQGFPLARILVMDDKAVGLERHPESLLLAPAWTGEASDTFLRDVIPRLDEFAVRDDLRVACAA